MSKREHKDISKSIKVIPMAEAEAEEISQLVESVIRPLEYYNERARKEEIEKYSSDNLLKLVREDSDAVLAAKAKSAIVGFCISRYDDGLLWLSWFGVRDDYRKNGIGEKLLIVLESSASRRRAHKIWCDTRTDNLVSQRALLKAGFKKTVLLSNHWYNQDFFLWEKYV